VLPLTKPMLFSVPILVPFIKLNRKKYSKNNDKICLNIHCARIFQLEKVAVVLSNCKTSCKCDDSIWNINSRNVSIIEK